MEYLVIMALMMYIIAMNNHDFKKEVVVIKFLVLISSLKMRKEQRVPTFALFVYYIVNYDTSSSVTNIICYFI